MKITHFATGEKQSQMLELLKYGTVMVFVDSRHKDVTVPDYLKGDFQLRLNFDYAFDIDDFRVLPDRLEASLSFNHKNHFCVIPFDAVYLFLNHSTEQGLLFTESVPAEMLEVFATMEKQSQPKESPLRPIATAQATAVKNTEPADNIPPEKNDDTTVKKEKKKRAHLRLVK